MKDNKIKICFFTGNRSEFSYIIPVIREIENYEDIEYKVIISGAHLDERYGETIEEIEKEGVNVDYKIKINSSDFLNKQVSEIIINIAKILRIEKPDYIYLSGDRYETYAAAVAAFFENVPIAHEGGGAITNGGCFDDSIRHAITKLASLHFTICKTNYHNIIKLGEENWRICLSGSVVVDTICKEQLLGKKELQNELNIDFNKPVILFTQHPVQNEVDMTKFYITQSLEALKKLGYQTIITYPNTDPGNEYILMEYEKYADTQNFRMVKSLGRVKYLSVMKYCSVVAGNSSSGLLETPIFKVPAVNIGTRQNGRIRSTNVIDADYSSEDIEKKIQKCINDKKFINEIEKCENPFGNGGASRKIIEFLRTNSKDRNLLLKKLL